MSNIELLNQLLELTVWLPIKDYPNYEVSICGQVRNITTKRILRPGLASNGYYIITLCKNKKHKSHCIHHLVCKTFIPNVDDKKCIDHIDSNRLNNTISNLRWASYQENSFNQQLSSNNTSGTKGVTWENNRWRARIEINGKKIHLGYFTNLEDAKNARRIKANELYGIYTNECEKIII